VSSTRRFPCEPASVPAARRFLREALDSSSVEVLEAAELMTSELASNCVCHARTGFEVTIACNDQIRVEVRDAGGGKPRLLSPSPREPAGRGLRIVEAMSDDWGVIPDSGGKVVWFTVTGAQPSGQVSTQKGSQRDHGGRSSRISAYARRALAPFKSSLSAPLMPSPRAPHFLTAAGRSV
jgi:anti-sigma regulatory factor (Ser/Thr protein kinase)